MSIPPYHHHSAATYGYEPYSPYAQPPRPQGYIERIRRMLLQAIRDETQAIDFYSRLISICPDRLHHDFIKRVLDDQQRHRQEFTWLYVDLFGEEPHCDWHPVTFNSYPEGLFRAFLAQMEMYRSYRETMLSTEDRAIHAVFFRAMHDKMEQANRFIFLYFTSHPYAQSRESGDDRLTADSNSVQNSDQLDQWTPDSGAGDRGER